MKPRSRYVSIGLKRYTQTMIRYDTIRQWMKLPSMTKLLTNLDVAHSSFQLAQAKIKSNWTSGWLAISCIDTRYGAHDTICSAIHLPFLAGKQRLVIPACHQKHLTPPTTTACTVMMRSGYNDGGLLRVSRCSVFVMNLLLLLEYTGCYLQYLMFVSNFGMCYSCTVSYRIFLRAYRDMYRTLCIGGIPVCRCIISTLCVDIHISI